MREAQKRYESTEKGQVAKARYRERHPERVREQKLQSLTKQLLRGEHIGNRSDHHKAMSAIKGPRPDGLELSLVNYHGPSAYWGYSKEERTRYRLSTDPDDYAWETRKQNRARREEA